MRQMLAVSNVGNTIYLAPNIVTWTPFISSRYARDIIRTPSVTRN